MSRIEVVLPPPTPAQRMVLSSPARFKLLVAGRRSGKTALGVLMCVKTALAGGRAWWVAPTYKHANVGWRRIVALAGQVPLTNILRAERTIAFPNGGEISVRSADRPDSLRSEGLDFVGLDEAAIVRRSAWEEELRPALADRRGKALLVSTPKGRNWFFQLYRKVAAGELPGWQAWSFTTAEAGIVAEDELVEAQRQLPEFAWRQEFLAEFVDDHAAVFRNVVECATAYSVESAVPGHAYVVGVDWGRSVDYTVFVVYDLKLSAVVNVDRFVGLDAAAQCRRLSALCERFRPQCVMVEANSIGAVMIDMLFRENLPIVPFYTTEASKALIIDALALAFERKSIAILPDPTLIAELQSFEMKRKPSGVFRYAAPDGAHDDTVIALALAYHAANSVPQKTETIWR